MLLARYMVTKDKKELKERLSNARQKQQAVTTKGGENDDKSYLKKRTCQLFQ